MSYGLLVIIISCFIGFLVSDFIFSLKKNPNFALWPVLSRCRLCGKPVFAWQKKEWRGYDARVRNTKRSDPAVSIIGSGLVHCRCSGIPKVIISF